MPTILRKDVEPQDFYSTSLGLVSKVRSIQTGLSMGVSSTQYIPAVTVDATKRYVPITILDPAKCIITLNPYRITYATNLTQYDPYVDQITAYSFSIVGGGHVVSSAWVAWPIRWFLVEYE